jgi:hypothetical protein
MPGELSSEVFYEPFKEAVSIVFKDYNDRIPDHMTQAMMKIIITHLSHVSQQKMKGVFYSKPSELSQISELDQSDLGKKWSNQSDNLRKIILATYQGPSIPQYMVRVFQELPPSRMLSFLLRQIYAKHHHMHMFQRQPGSPNQRTGKQKHIAD